MRQYLFCARNSGSTSAFSLNGLVNRSNLPCSTRSLRRIQAVHVIALASLLYFVYADLGLAGGRRSA
jgi:hypothetical protein